MLRTTTGSNSLFSRVQSAKMFHSPQLGMKTFGSQLTSNRYSEPLIPLSPKLEKKENSGMAETDGSLLKESGIPVSAQQGGTSNSSIQEQKQDPNCKEDFPTPVQAKNTPAKKSSQIYPDETFGAGYERKSFGDKLLIQELREHTGGSNRLLDKIDCPFFMFQPDTYKVRQKKPWLPEKRKDRKYTLVLDLDETLIHFEETQDGTSHFLLRPYAQNFIKEMAKHYEVIIFTAAQKDYADFILDRMDTESSISHRLYRNNCSYCDNVYQKDLTKLDRDLSKTLIVDNNPDNFQLQPENGIYIRS